MLLGGALCGEQVDGIIGFQGDIAACRDLAAPYSDVRILIRTRGAEVDIVARRHRRILCGAAGLGAVALALGTAHADAYTDTADSLVR